MYVNEIDQKQKERVECVVLLLPVGYIQKRAWNSGFHTGMGKRNGNRITGQVENVLRQIFSFSMLQMLKDLLIG